MLPREPLHTGMRGGLTRVHALLLVQPFDALLRFRTWSVLSDPIMYGRTHAEERRRQLGP